MSHYLHLPRHLQTDGAWPFGSGLLTTLSAGFYDVVGELRMMGYRPHAGLDSRAFVAQSGVPSPLGAWSGFSRALGCPSMVGEFTNSTFDPAAMGPIYGIWKGVVADTVFSTTSMEPAAILR